MAVSTAFKSPLDALAGQLAHAPHQVCFVQPTGGGQLREYSWQDVDDEARRMAAHLRAQDFPAGSHIGLMSKNCAEWIIADLAIWMAGHVTVPLYPTLAAKTVAQILEHSESKLLFVGKLDDWDSMKAGVPGGLPCIAFSLAPSDALQRYPRWTDLIEKSSPLTDICQLQPEQLATITYTSGTTGMPKGVMQDFRRVALLGTEAGKIYGMAPGDRLISYLPLSHVAERCAVEIAMLYNGMTVYFAESLETFAADIQRARPTVFFAVPRIWTKFYQKVSEKMPPKKLARLLRIPLLGGVLRRKILSAMGLDQCRLALSGAAALAPELIEWYKRLGLEILEVYGMTENMAWSHATRAGEQMVGSVGKVAPGVECRLSDIGEILVKSPGNMLGYYKEPQMTADAFVDGDWLRTGDKGVIDHQGRLRITGRIKEIFKTSKGKYVAPAPIENLLVAFPGIELVSVVGDNMAQPIALINLTPEEKARLKGIERDAFTANLKEHVARLNEQLDPHEHLAAAILVQENWTVENGIITPTLKIKRNELEKHYGERLSKWQEAKGVVWE
ncbi:MAG: AMP-binding protein [Moraxellaceae bacterium]